MKIQNVQNERESADCRSWIIYSTSNMHHAAQIKVDQIFSTLNYFFYPELEWSTYGYRPPEGKEILGAWRHPKLKSFAFLLNDITIKKNKENCNFLIHVAGENFEIKRINDKITKLKSELALEDAKSLNSLNIDKKIDKVRKSKSPKIIIGIIAVLTNAYVFIVQKGYNPNFVNEEWEVIYNYFLIFVHFFALICVTSLIFFAFYYMIKYLILLSKEL